jgi:cell division protein FtsB
MSTVIRQLRRAAGGSASGQTRERRRLQTVQDVRLRRRRMISYGLLAISAVLMVNALVGDNGYLATIRVRSDVDALVDSINRLQAENQRLRETARRLTQDPDALEEAARHDLGLIRPGETLVIIKNPRPATSSPIPH